MEQIDIFKQIAEMLEKLKQRLSEIELEEQETIAISELSLMEIDEVTRHLKILISKYNFRNIAEEIYFFKQMKPQFISLYIYHSTVLNVETCRPIAGQKILRKYYENEIEKLNAFYEENAEFYSYCRRKATYMDHKYFVRNSFDIKMKMPQTFYNYDESFTTSHDHQVAQILAYEKLEMFYKRMTSKTVDSIAANQLENQNIVWSATKVSLIELIYGLHKMRCFNGGNVELSEIMKFTEKTFKIDLGNYHKTIFEIRSRKSGTTKFLQLLTDNLNQYFIDSENI
ncbi:RteC domain-containing protein [Chryseobacterium sp. S0630]|uniref:RteC domain-containing protein n=1 Tax=Chryseobacterium sp. S0630 TaxID=2957803 RepID=UPI0020A19301|nr:RteC domain-containing protein [Chryseobacterium sp. S0630]MCP1299190.1 RteC domain-containing protein [Chryseobacterium sp. S0630]